MCQLYVSYDGWMDGWMIKAKIQKRIKGKKKSWVELTRVGMRGDSKHGWWYTDCLCSGHSLREYELEIVEDIYESPPIIDHLHSRNKREREKHQGGKRKRKTRKKKGGNGASLPLPSSRALRIALILNHQNSKPLPCPRTQLEEEHKVGW